MWHEWKRRETHIGFWREDSPLKIQLGSLKCRCRDKEVKLSCNKSWRLRGGMECWAPVLALTFDTTRTAELSAPHDGALNPKKIPWYSFLLEAEWNQGLLNADGRIRALEDFQETNRKSNPRPPFNQLRHRSYQFQQ